MPRGSYQLSLSKGLDETMRTPTHHTAEHHTAGSEILQSHTAWSNGYDPELVSVEDVVDVRCYAILSCMPEMTTTISASVTGHSVPLTLSVSVASYQLLRVKRIRVFCHNYSVHHFYQW